MIVIKLKRFIAPILIFTQFFTLPVSAQAQPELSSPPELKVTEDGGVIHISNGFSSESLLLNPPDEIEMLEDTLPSSYNSDLSNLEYVSPVKNQYSYGLCWAFSSSACMESLLMKYNNVKTVPDSSDSYDLSEIHTAYALSNKFADFGYQRTFSSGGNTSMYESYVTKARNSDKNDYNGPVKESDFPYPSRTSTFSYALNDYSDDDALELLKKDTLNYLPSAYSSMDFSSSNLSADGITERNNVIKKALLENGAVEISIYCGESISNSYSNFYTADNKDTVFYYTDSSKTNHSVTVVGYDDNYDCSNFSGFATVDGVEATPTNNGAFIVKNSWGSSWGNNGYFYMSYDSQINSLSYFSKPIEKTDFDNLYDYSPNLFIGGSNAYTTTGSDLYYDTFSGNVFYNAKKGEKITRIGTGSYSGGEFVRFYIDTDAGTDSESSSSEKFGGLEYVSVKPVNDDTTIQEIGGKDYIYIEKPGYYIFELETPVTVTGNSFSVIGEYASKKDVGTGKAYPPSEYSGNTSYITTEKDGNSYYSYSLSGLASSPSKSNYDIVIKAYTQNPDVEITIDGKAQTVKYGETIASDSVLFKKDNGKYYEFDKLTEITDSLELFTADYIKAPEIEIIGYQKNKENESEERIAGSISKNISEDISEIKEIGINYFDSDGNYIVTKTITDLFSESIDGYKNTDSENTYLFVSDPFTDKTIDGKTFSSVSAYINYILNGTETVVNYKDFKRE